MYRPRIAAFIVKWLEDNISLPGMMFLTSELLKKID